MNDKNYPPIALGTWSWGVGVSGGDQVFGNHLDMAELRPVFEAAMAHGLCLWDTAAAYGMGASEKIVGSLAKEYPRSEVILSTKFTPRLAGSAEGPMKDMCEESLRRLQTDCIDIYWIHNASDVERWTPYLIPLVKSGRVKHVGVSNHDLAQIKRVEEILAEGKVPLSAVQNHFSLLCRVSEKEGILDYCRSRGIDFFAYMVLEQGALSGKYSADHPMPSESRRGQVYNPLLPQIQPLINAMREVGAAHGASASQVGIAWAIVKGAIPIIGATRPEQIQDIAKAAAVRLTAADRSMLEQTAAAIDVDTRGTWEHAMR